MADYIDTIRTLLAEADWLPMSPGRMALLEEAVRLADLHQDMDWGIETRRALMIVARNLIRGDSLTAAFVWCLAQYDRDPQRFGGRNLLIEYHWVIGQLANLADVSRSKLDEMLAEFGRRLELSGFTRRHVYFTQQQIARDLGDRALAHEATKALHQIPADGLSFGPMWELAEEVESELFVGRQEKAIHLAKPFLDDRCHDRMKSDEVCAYLLIPLWQRGEAERTRALQKRCRRSYRPQHLYYWWFGEMMKFSALANDLAQVVRSYGECQRAQHRLTDPLSRLHFALDAVVALDRLAAEGKHELTLRLPEVVPVPRTSGRYAVVELRDWLAREADQLADLFDARNGTSHFREQVARNAELSLCFRKNPC
jgi:hypothetical protein